jgi:cytochrome c peroxidase
MRETFMTIRFGFRFLAQVGLLVVMLTGLSACGGGDSPPAQHSDTAFKPSDNSAAPVAVVDDPVAVHLGDLLFHDPRLSASGQMSCGTCHAEAFGHADAPGGGLPKGGANLDRSGMRSSMTARYLNATPPFQISANGTPSGGYLWDGRADNRFGQAFHGGPFFNPDEMALPGSAADPRALTDLVRNAPYWPELQALYATQPERINTDQNLFREIAVLLEAYQRGDEDYNLFDSHFDGVRKGTATFTAQQARGWAIFSDKNRGNCVACHSAGLRDAAPLFTNFGYAALGVPRNHAGPKNADPAFYDLGLCARDKAGADPVAESAVRAPKYCGLFKTPTLRNVERTAPYFHNGVAASLEAAVRFHFERDALPAKWYRKADGTTDAAYNDLPQRHHRNLARGKPFNGSYLPADGDIADLLAFLQTLNDADQTEPLPTPR